MKVKAVLFGRCCHAELYEWLNSGRNVELESFNERVYGMMFRTPSDDKWLGLYS